MYYVDGIDNSYLQSPGEFELDPYLINNADETTWDTLSLTSPYIFIPTDNSRFSGSASQPLAISKETHYYNKKYFVLYEDGHVSTLDNKELLEILYPQIEQLKTQWKKICELESL